MDLNWSLPHFPPSVQPKSPLKFRHSKCIWGTSFVKFYLLSMQLNSCYVNECNLHDNIFLMKINFDGVLNEMTLWKSSGCDSGKCLTFTIGLGFGFEFEFASNFCDHFSRSRPWEGTWNRLLGPRDASCPSLWGQCPNTWEFKNNFYSTVKSFQVEAWGPAFTFFDMSLPTKYTKTKWKANQGKRVKTQQPNPLPKHI